MKRDQSNATTWQNSLLLIAGVALAVIIALLLAQADTYQRRSVVPSDSLPFVDLESTVAAGDTAVVYLPSEVSPTPIPPAAPTQTSPVAEEVTPAAPVTAMASACDGAEEGWSPYIVKAGDSILSLAQKHDLSIDTILDANCLSREKIIAGQQLVLPLDHEGGREVSECETPPEWAQYIVTSRDSIAKLARAHGTSVYRLIEANCLESNNVVAGQKIFVPLNPKAGGSPDSNNP